MLSFTLQNESWVDFMKRHQRWICSLAFPLWLTQNEMTSHNTLLHQKYSFKNNNNVIKPRHFSETFWFFSADKLKSWTCLWFSLHSVPVSLCSCVTDLKKVNCFSSTRQMEMKECNFLYSFLGCFHFSVRFITSQIEGFHACASYLIINKFLKSSSSPFFTDTSLKDQKCWCKTIDMAWNFCTHG